MTRRRGGDGYNYNMRPKSHSRQGVALFALYFTATVLLVLSRVGHERIAEARAALSDWSVPVLEALSKPAAEIRHGVERARTTMDLLGEIARLRAKNQRLEDWEWRAKMLTQRNRQLEALLNVVDEPALDYVSGRVIADSRGPFMRSVLINVGRKHSVKNGFAVINKDGLVGRLVTVGEAASRVLLLTDLKSRIPVYVGAARARAVLAGDNSAYPSLEFLPESANVRAGDDVYTSGHDGLLPRGLRVGEVFGNASSFRVSTAADLNRFENVSVLFFDAPALLTAKALDKSGEDIAEDRTHPQRPIVSVGP